MSKSFLIFVYLILFQLTIEIRSQNTFVPKKRGTHTATLINYKLYILGGYALSGMQDNNETVGQQFFYIDLSEPLSVKNGIKWVDLTNIPVIPPHARAAAVGDGDKLILYGGEPFTRELAKVYVFDTKSLIWSPPALGGNYHPLSKSGLFPAINNKKMYLFGGYLYNKFDQNNYAEDMAILDTTTFSFAQGNSTNAPTPRGYYGAVLLPNQKILYIGKKVFFKEIKNYSLLLCICLFLCLILIRGIK